jgi:hypothetical protein
MNNILPVTTVSAVVSFVKAIHLGAPGRSLPAQKHQFHYNRKRDIPM